MIQKPASLGEVQLAYASPGRAWWHHHILNTRALAEATFAGNTPVALAAVGQLWDAVRSWEILTRSPIAGVLMGEHTVLAKMLIECLAAATPECVKTVTDALGKNVQLTRKLFPKDPGAFADLFGVHTGLAGTYITDLAKGDQAAFQGHWTQALANGRLLGTFTDKAFVVYE